AIDINDLSPHEPGRVGRQQPHHPGDVVGLSPATEKRFLHGTLLPVVGGVCAPGGANPTGGDAVDTHVWGGRFGEAPGEGQDRALGGPEHLATLPLHPEVDLAPTNVDD